MDNCKFPTLDFVITGISDSIFHLIHSNQTAKKYSRSYTFLTRKFNGSKTVLDVINVIKNILQRVFKTEKLPLHLPEDQQKAEALLSILANSLQVNIQILEFQIDKIV